MNLISILIVLACLCAVWYVVATLLIYENLRRRDLRVSFLWLRVMAPWYAFRYREITKKETGKVGALFYHWIVSINSALAIAVLAFVVHNL
jgi:hypothetical protein